MTSTRPLRLAPAALALGLLAAACGKSPVSYSAPVGISLDARSQEVAQGRLSVEKNVNTETGNPYAAFVNDAVRALGRPPSTLEVTSVTLTLGASSSGVTALEQVLTGVVTTSFRMKTSGTVIPVASTTDPRGTGPVAMALLAPPSGYTAEDYDDLLAGNFFVVLDGPAAPGFGTAGATARMTATFTFVAYE